MNDYLIIECNPLLKNWFFLILKRSHSHSRTNNMELQKQEQEQSESQKTELLPYENKLFVGHCIDVLKTIQSGSIDVAITSPPYDDLRAYKGNYKLDLTQLGKEVFRVLKDGGIYVMVIQDQTKNYAKSLTSFRTADLAPIRLPGKTRW